MFSFVCVSVFRIDFEGVLIGFFTIGFLTLDRKRILIRIGSLGPTCHPGPASIDGIGENQDENKEDRENQEEEILAGDAEEKENQDENPDHRKECRIDLSFDRALGNRTIILGEILRRHLTPSYHSYDDRDEDRDEGDLKEEGEEKSADQRVPERHKEEKDEKDWNK